MADWFARPEREADAKRPIGASSRGDCVAGHGGDAPVVSDHRRDRMTVSKMSGARTLRAPATNQVNKSTPSWKATHSASPVANTSAMFSRMLLRYCLSNNDF